MFICYKQKSIYGVQKIGISYKLNRLYIENCSKMLSEGLQGRILQEKQNTRWFKYDRDWFVCKQAALRSSCATLREWSHNLHPPSCSG